MKLALSIVMVLFFVSCSSNKNQTVESNQKEIHSKYEAAVYATAWYQTSAEAKALYYQGYTIAKQRIDEAVKTKTKKLKAVVLDIDETVLNNSRYQGKLIKENIAYPKYWTEWVNSRQAVALPGALEFLNYAIKKGVHVFYVTNRTTEERQGTIDNLKAMGLPLMDENHLFVREKESNKTVRRDTISKNYEIVLLVGDNLNDFTGLYEKKSLKERDEVTDQLKDEFGKKFIILPNPMYGDWDSAIFLYNHKLSDEEKDVMRKDVLKSF